MVPGTGANEVATWAPSPWFLLTPPQAAGDVIGRPRLLALLDDVVLRSRVTLVTAPAGFGKTTAVAEWSRRSRECVAWLSLTRFDEHPGRLFRGLASALARLADESGDLRFAPLRAIGTDLADLDDAYRAIVAAVEAVAVPVVVVLDDVHLLGPRAAKDVLGLLVQHAPAALHLVLVGRYVPPLPLQRLRVAGKLGEVTADDLGFTPDEVVGVTHAAGRSLDPDAAAAIHAETSGWPAAVRLALVDGHPGRPQVRRPDTAPVRLVRDSHLADYVVEEILDGLRPELCRFVLDVTTCELLDRQLAVALSGDDDSAALLEECRRLGLFLDRFTDAANEPVYRWHAVFAEQCRTILVGRDPERADRLDRVAAGALASRFPLQAIVHARRAGDPALATRVIADHWLELVLRSDIAALEQQCLALPPAWTESAIVLLVRACCRNLADDRATAQTLIARADAVARSAGHPAADGSAATARRSDATSSSERYQVARGLAALLLADGNVELQGASDRVARLLREPVGWTPATHAAATFLLGWIGVRLRWDPPGTVRLLQAAQVACTATGQHVVASRAVVNGAFALAYAGRFAAARHKLAEVLPPDTGLDRWTSLEYAIEWLTDGFVAYWQDDLDLALRRLRVQAVRPDVPGSPSAVGRGYFGYAAVADGRPSLLDEAAQLLREASRGERHGVPFHVYPHLGLAMVAIARGRPRRARALLDAIPDYPHTHIVRAQMGEAYRQVGDPQEALARLAGLAPVGGQLPYVNATAWTTRALIEFAAGDARSAHACLHRALDAAVPESVRRPFVGPDPLLRDLLAEHAARGTPHTDFVADCLARCAVATARRSVGEPLTRRELEILGYLRTTMTVTEIAAAMGLSVNTVKTHLRTTYRKLDVANRRDAVRVTS